jgi:hypothetical protein
MPGFYRPGMPSILRETLERAMAPNSHQGSAVKDVIPGLSFAVRPLVCLDQISVWNDDKL